MGPFSTFGNNFLDVVFTGAFGIVGMHKQDQNPIQNSIANYVQVSTLLSFSLPLCSSRTARRRHDTDISTRRTDRVEEHFKEIIGGHGKAETRA